MFEIRCIVKDKHLHQVLRALKDLTLEPPVVIPVDGDIPGDIVGTTGERPERPKKRGKARRKSANNEGIVEVFEKHFEANPNLEVISRKEMIKIGVAKGYSPGAQSYAYTVLSKRGRIQPSAENGVYKIVHN